LVKEEVGEEGRGGTGGIKGETFADPVFPPPLHFFALLFHHWDALPNTLLAFFPRLSFTAAIPSSIGVRDLPGEG